jgi:hypothetical protein
MRPEHRIDPRRGEKAGGSVNDARRIWHSCSISSSRAVKRLASSGGVTRGSGTTSGGAAMNGTGRRRGARRDKERRRREQRERRRRRRARAREAEARRVAAGARAAAGGGRRRRARRCDRTTAAGGTSRRLSPGTSHRCALESRRSRRGVGSLLQEGVANFGGALSRMYPREGSDPRDPSARGESVGSPPGEDFTPPLSPRATSL